MFDAISPMRCERSSSAAAWMPNRLLLVGIGMGRVSRFDHARGFCKGRAKWREWPSRGLPGRGLPAAGGKALPDGGKPVPPETCRPA